MWFECARAKCVKEWWCVKDHQNTVCVSFFTLMRLGELTFPDSVTLWDPHKLTKQNTFHLHPTYFQFFLLGHKADQFFQRNTVIICENSLPCNPMKLFWLYIAFWDHWLPLSSPLWLTATGSIPTRTFFIQCLHLWFDKDITGQSMQVGGAMFLAENRVAPHIIQGIGCWALTAWQIYNQKHTVLLQVMLTRQRYRRHRRRRWQRIRRLDRLTTWFLTHHQQRRKQHSHIRTYSFVFIDPHYRSDLKWRGG